MTNSPLLPVIGLTLLLSGAALCYMLVMGHDDPFRLAVAALTGALVALGTAPLLLRAKG
jgi:hypothetical protein